MVPVNEHNVLANVKLAETYYDSGKLEYSLSICQELLENNVDVEQGYQIKARVLKKQAHNKLVEAAKTYIELGDWYLKRKQFHKAANSYQEAIICTPKVAILHQKLGNALTHQQRYWFDKSLRADLVKHGKIDQAIIAYQQAINLNTNNFWSHLYLGDALTIKERFEEAANSYQAALKRKVSLENPNFIEKYWKPGQRKDLDFVIIGAAKCGTTSLYEYMIQHPQILQAVKKEIDFFLNFDRGVDWYMSHFPPTPKEETKFVTGEASTSYFSHHNTRERLFKLFPKTKLIAILRNPVDRAISHYYNDVKYGGERRSLEVAMQEELDILEGLENPILEGKEYWKSQRGYLWLGMYVYFIEKWLTFFPREQLLILRSEDFYQEPELIMHQVFNFLELPKYDLGDYKAYNKGSYSIPNACLKSKLSDFFKTHNKRLEKYIDREFYWN